MSDSYHKSVAWIFDGVEDELIGDFGLAAGGAAGIEIDRYDLTLGTPGTLAYWHPQKVILTIIPSCQRRLHLTFQVRVEPRIIAFGQT